MKRGISSHDNDIDYHIFEQERRKEERAEEERRMAEQRAAEDARRKAEEVNKLIRVNYN